MVGHYSTDGSGWTPVGRPAALPANAQIGLFAFSNDGTGAPIAAFDSFTLTTPGAGGGGGGGRRPARATTTSSTALEPGHGPLERDRAPRAARTAVSGGPAEPDHVAR